MNHNPRSGFGPEITETKLRDVGLKSLNAFLIEWAYSLHERGVPTSQIRQWLIPTTITREEREEIMRTLIARDLKETDLDMQAHILHRRGLSMKDVKMWLSKNTRWMYRAMILSEFIEREQPARVREMA